MKKLLKNAREIKDLKTREVAQLLGIDQALISKFESGTRKPTRDQVIKLASLLEIDLETIMIAWLKEKILHEIGQDEFALKALLVAEQEIRSQNKSTTIILSAALQKILTEIDILKAKLDTFRQYESSSITTALELEYTYDSNRLEGNTMTLRETDLVINEGITIAGKSMREHLEAINHQEAIAFIKDLAQKKISFNEAEFLSIHNLILRGILPQEAGRYRKVHVMIKGSTYIPPQPNAIPNEMEAFFIWYEANKNKIHTIVLAAELHERLTKTHPFIDGNGITARLVMNLILLQNGYVITNIKGDYESRIQYNQTLETAQNKNNKEDFMLFVAQTQKENLARYIGIISQ